MHKIDGIGSCNHMQRRQCIIEKGTELSGKISRRGDCKRTIRCKEYDKLQKVYSIWICFGCNRKIANTITSYFIRQKALYGMFEDEARYDLMQVVMVRISKEGALHKSTNPPTLLHEMLYDLFVAKMDTDKKLKLLNQRYDMETESLKEGINTMCNLSELVEERGYNSGRKEGISEGENIMVQVIHRLQSGESPESIIDSGIEERTVRLAQTCL